MEPPTEPRCDRPFPKHRRKLARLSAVVTVAVAVIIMTAWNAGLGRGSRPPNIMLLYVGAEDCAPCRAWRKGDGAAFFASAEFARITYREVRSAHLEEVLNDENWPEDIRGYRSSIKRSDGVPLWLIISDHAIVEQRFGTPAWHERVLPALRSYLR